MGNLFGIGGSSLASRMLGAKKEKEIKYVSSFCFYSGICVTLVFAGFSLLCRTQLLQLLGGSEENIGYAET